MARWLTFENMLPSPQVHWATVDLKQQLGNLDRVGGGAFAKIVHDLP